MMIGTTVLSDALPIFLLIVIGLTSGYFVVPMNALLQHRGHVLLSAGHSIAVQNFNEQLNILLMVAIYTLMLWLNMSIGVIIAIFGILVAALMVLIIQWSRLNLRKDLPVIAEIGKIKSSDGLSSSIAVLTTMLKSG